MKFHFYMYYDEIFFSSNSKIFMILSKQQKVLLNIHVDKFFPIFRFIKIISLDHETF
jgi:hypothetical protein